MSRFQFSNVVVVDDDQIGVIVKCWGDDTYEVYVRCYNAIRTYKTKDIQYYVYHKILAEDEHEYYSM